MVHHMSSVFLLFPALYTGSMPTRMPPHAYADWKGCLRPRFFILGARVPPRGSLLDGHVVVTKYFPKRFTVGVLNATLDLASFVLVGVAAFLGRWSRCLRAASAEPTRAYAVEPRQIPRNHLSYSYKFICITSCTYSGNYIYICINKLVDNLHIPSHLENANEHLPTRLAYAKKI